jgi:site-specific DNA-cytosine methylase
MDDNNSFIMEPQVLTPKRTEYGKQVRKQYENKQINESRHNMNELTPRTDGMANTLSTVQKDNLLMEPTASVSPQRKLEFKGDKGFSNISPSLRSSDYKSPHVVKEPQIINYRIRKLTPTECFRLMDVDDADIDKLLNSGISNSQLYKMAGNSIVVSCLFHIFRKLFVETHNESQQLTLF